MADLRNLARRWNDETKTFECPAEKASPDEGMRELRELSERATAGEWHWGVEDIDAIWAPDTVGDGNVVCLPPPAEVPLSVAQWPANAAFIVACVNYVRSKVSGATDEGMRERIRREAFEEAADLAEKQYGMIGLAEAIRKLSDTPEGIARKSPS